MANIPLAQFAERVRRSQILELEHQKELSALEGQCADARALAQELIRRGRLTPYQVNQLFQDRGSELVLGQYIILERLGAGGMGQVFKACQRNLQRIVALKVIRRECLDNSKAIQRFQREIRAAGQLSHPNIVRAYDADEVNGIYFIAMELIDGVDLAQLVHETGLLHVAQACDYIRQAALGLQHAHECGMVHRDIKPANLLVTQARDKRKGSGPTPRPGSAVFQRPSSAVLARPQAAERWGTVKVLDMGLARWNTPEDGQPNLTQMGTLMGTPDFIAPEQAINSRTVDIRADIYSLGCTLYYLLTGQVPFPDGAILDKIIRHQTAQPLPAQEVRRPLVPGADVTKADEAFFHVPAEVQAVLDKMLAKHPRDRFQTPGDLADALGQVLLALDKPDAVTAGQPDKTVVQACPIPTAPPAGTAKPEQPAPLPQSPQRLYAIRLPRKWLTIAAVAAALCVGMVLSQVGARGKPRANPPADDDGSWLKTESREEVLWQKLAAKAKKKSTDLAELRHDLIRFRSQFYNTPQARAVPALLATLPSPFDQLERPKIDKKQVFEWQPKEVVGVLGSWLMLADSKVPDPRYQHALAVSPDGRYVVSGGPKGLLRTWDVTTQVEHKIFGHSKQILRIAFAPDGRAFATAGLDGTTKLWDAQTHTVIATLDKQDRELAPGRSKHISALAFSPDGTRLASGGGEGLIRLWDVTTGTLKKSIEAQITNIMSVTFTSDGRQLLWAGEAGQVRWTSLDATTPDKAALFRTGSGVVKTLAVSPDGQTVILNDGREGGLRLCSWNGVTLKEIATAHKHAAMVHGIAFSPDCKTFVSVSEDKTVKLWDTRTARVLQSWELRWPVVGVAFAPDGRHFLTANGNSTIFVFRPGTIPGDAVAAR